MKKLVILSVIFLSATALYAQQNFLSEGDRMAAAGNYTGAAERYERCMEQDIRCLLRFCELIVEGKIVAESPDQLFRLVSPHAQRGNALAQNYLGWMYSGGRGVTRNEAEAVNWYRKSAEQGHETAQFNLGFMYENGRGVTRNITEATKWYRRAAEQGNTSAREALTRLGASATPQNVSATQNFTVTGKVTDALDGESVPGVNIVVKGTTAGTISNVDGEYRITVPNENAVLQFSFLGYKTVEMTVARMRIIDVAMFEEALQIRSVVFTAVLGLNFTNINNNDKTFAFTPDAKTSFHVGLNCRFPLIKYANSRLETSYSRHGFEANSQKVDMDYISANLMFSRGWGYLSPIHFYIEAGPYLGYMNAVKPNTFTIDNTDFQLSELKYKYDAGLALGVGITPGYRFSRPRPIIGTSLDFRYYHGFSNNDYLLWKNRFTVGVRFDYIYIRRMGLEINYSQGLSDMSDNLQWTNKVTTLSLRYRM